LLAFFPSFILASYSGLSPSAQQRIDGMGVRSATTAMTDLQDAADALITSNEFRWPRSTFLAKTNANV
jgi:hypothetical protein